MKGLRKLYLHNSIFRFMISYAGVLLIPLLVCLLSYQFAFITVKQDIIENNLSTLTKSRNLIDSQLQGISSLMKQSADNATIISFTDKEFEKPNLFYADASKVISELAYIFKYSNTNILDDIYLYIDKTDYIVTTYDLYRTSLYFARALDEEITYEDWILQLKNEQNYQHYIASDKKIKCIQRVPFGTTGSSKGAIVCNLSKERLKSYFDNVSIENGASLFITDAQGNLLFTLSNEAEVLPVISEKNSNKQVFEQNINGTKSTVFNISSTGTGWNYLLVLPKKVIMKRLTTLKVIISVLFCAALIIGMVISYYMAKKSGKPIEDAKKKLIDMDEDIDVADITSISSLSGTLTHIMSQKQLLASELEKQKPYLEAALFQKLIKGEFANQKEIRYICQRTHIDLEAESYWVISCRFFGNNDMFNLDEQTIEDVNLLKILLKENIQNLIHERMFFYDLDQLTLTIILPGNESTHEQIKDSIGKVSQQITEEYGVTPYWGISEECKNLLQLWRAFVQSKSALKKGIQEGAQNLIEYNEVTQDETTYYYPQVLEQQLMGYVKEGNREGIKKQLDIVYIENFESRHLSEITVDKLYTEMKGTILKLTRQDDTQFYIESISKYMTLKDDESAKICFSKITDLYMGISATYSEEKKVQQSKLIHRIMDYINQEYSNPNLGLGMIASNFNISEGYVSSLFKEQAGINFTEYVEKQRIDKACELLKTSNQSINDISEQIGYNSVQSFRRAFKRLHGFSPSELRKKSIV